MVSPLNHEIGSQLNSNEKKGCSGTAAIIFLSLWILLISLITQIANWTIFQMLFEGSIKISNILWLLPLIYGFLLFIPLIIAERVVLEPAAKNRIRALRIISILIILLSPSRLPDITNWQLIAVIQVAALAVFIAGVMVFNRAGFGASSGNSAGRSGKPFLAAASGALLGIPWVIWGAQGSLIDSILAILVCAGLGLTVGSLLIPRPTRTTSDDLEKPVQSGIGVVGWIVTLGLIILGTGIDQSNNGWMFSVSALPLGFACAALAIKKDGSIDLFGRLSAGILAGLAFLWPMLMIDPDELSLVTSSGTGELVSYAVMSVGITFGLTLLVFILLIILRNVLSSRDVPFNVGATVFIFTWGGLMGLYFLLGTPGFYGEKVFVILKDQADLAAIETIPNAMDRRIKVYSTLTRYSAETQKDIREWLDSKNIPYKPYYLVNAIELNADPILRASLASRGDVDRVLDSPMLRPLRYAVPVSKGTEDDPQNNHWNIHHINADKVQRELHIYGEGIIVGQSDSGMQGDHPEFAAQYRGRQDGTDDYNWFDPWFGSSKPVDIGGHGTHTLGSILGERVGIAPKAQWIGCVNLARNLGNPGYYLDCMQFMLAPFPQKGDPFIDGKPEKGANVLNNSWGCPSVEGCDPGVFSTAVKALRTAGIFVVASAGNSGMGGCSTVQDPPAIYEDVYTVGAIDSNGNLAGFSSLGPVNVDGSGRTKPDIVAPGVDVYSSYPGSTYKTASGTSMAGPQVVGVVALMWSANPRLMGDIEMTRQILNQTADRYTGVLPGCTEGKTIPGNDAGYGVVNAYKAVEKALETR